jgi:hypothetical protein
MDVSSRAEIQRGSLAGELRRDDDGRSDGGCADLGEPEVTMLNPT